MRGPWYSWLPLKGTNDSRAMRLQAHVGRQWLRPACFAPIWTLPTAIRTIAFALQAGTRDRHVAKVVAS